MRGKNRVHRRKNRFHRWLVIMMTIALLVGQGNVTVLAEEENAPAETGISDGQTPDAENGDMGSSGAADNGAGGDSTGNGGDVTDGTANGADGSAEGNGGTSGDDAGNGAGDYEDAGQDDGKGDHTENKADGVTDNKENTDGQEPCICETKCDMDNVNAECPVCEADYAVCAGEIEETGNDVLEAEFAEEDALETAQAEVALLTAEDGVEAYTVGDTFEDGAGITYSVINDGEVEVTGHKDGKALSGALVIPEETTNSDSGETYRVTGIGEKAFAVCSSLSSITIPDSVTSIGKRAFSSCTSLGSIEIPSGVASIQEWTFSDCDKLKSVKIPDSVTGIEKGAFARCRSLGSIEIPKGVTDIGYGAFSTCISLSSIEIPVGVKRIEDQTFTHCTNLSSIEIPDSVTSIGMEAFCACESLSRIKIPNGVTSIGFDAFGVCSSLDNIEIPDSVTDIDSYAFRDCASLSSIEIPDGVTTVKLGTFQNCTNLERIKISDKISDIGEKAFENCSKLGVMQIEVSADQTIVPPEVGERAFLNLPDDREIVLLAGSNTGAETLEKVAAEYLKDSRDGNDTDALWWGWKVTGGSGVENTYVVTIHVKKDGQAWDSHGRSFALRTDDGSGFVTDLTQVKNGSYSIYDITGLAPVAYAASAKDTGVKVTVADGPVEEEVNYYTVTFYDETTAYGAGTPQKPQIVLSGTQAAKPTDPAKTGWQFAGWKTADGGSMPYDFNSAVTETTAIYAGWVEKTTADPFHITATATAGGTISPAGYIAVAKGGEQSFEITPNEGYRIKAVTVDDADVTAALEDTRARAQAETKYYTFTNVTADHTIHATFESDGGSTGPGGGDNPNPGGGDDNNKPGGGGTGDDSNSPDGGGGAGTGSNPGGDGNNSDLDSGNSAGGTQLTTVSEEASAQAGTDTADNTVSVQTADGTEPKTGDSTHMEVYATLAMIAGLTYMVLYFMDEARGMSEREKDAFVAAFIRWGKKGGTFRKCCAMAAIFCLLAYYHTIGKRVGEKKSMAISF